jgi:thiosulfate dehydrogenase
MNPTQQDKNPEQYRALVSVSRALAVVCFLLVVFVVIVIILNNTSVDKLSRLLKFSSEPVATVPVQQAKPASAGFWSAPDIAQANELVRYGHKLVSNTAYYLGPQGTVANMSNGMNCQNCHLDAGTRIFGNNYSAVSSTYPKFRPRSGTIETVAKRVNDCVQRSLNGTALDTSGTEMKALVAYIQWVGSEVDKGVSPKCAGLVDVPLLNRAADPARGLISFNKHCVSCHGADGQGQRANEGYAYVYPPLWGKSSYNTGAGLYRLSRFAGYIKANMPLGATHDKPVLTDEEAWDIAAFVNSQLRPVKDLTGDWPDISKKPFDHPFGPYSDGFSVQQHKFGPFGPIKKAQKKS